MASAACLLSRNSLYSAARPLKEMENIVKAYKWVTVQPDDSLASWMATELGTDWAAHYAKNVVTKFKRGTGGYVFQSPEDAWNFMDGRSVPEGAELWECEIPKGSKIAARIVHFRFLHPLALKEFWDGCPDMAALMEAPTGTMLAKTVKLTRRIYPEDAENG